MRFGLHVANFGAFWQPGEVAELAAVAEEAGWEGLFVWDHTARAEGVVRLADPWVTLAAVATRTRRMVIGPLITPPSRRRPWNVSRAAVSLDHLSGGRMVLGVGLGVTRGPELTAFGEITDERTRGDMLDEALELLREAWSGQPVHHAGTHYTVDDVTFLPPPVRGHLPIWGATERVDGRPVRRAAGLDGVFPFGVAPARLDALRDNLARYRGGDLDGYDVVGGGTDDWEDWQAHGATWWLRVLPWREELAASLRIAEAGPPR